MKKINILVFLLLVGVVTGMISSCEKNMGPPTIDFLEADGFVSNDTILMVGDTITVGVLIEWNGANSLEKLDVIVSGQLLSSYMLEQDRGEYSFKLMKSASDEEVWEFLLQDSKGNTATKEITLRKDPNSIFGGLLRYDGMRLGAQANPTVPGFLSFDGPTLYDINSAFLKQSTIDLLYYYDDNDGHVIASPGANIPDGVFTGDHRLDTWTTLRTTQFQKADFTGDEFNSFFHDGFLVSNYDEEKAKRKAKNLEEEDVYIFKTESGLLGAFYVHTVAGFVDGELSITVVIQE